MKVVVAQYSEWAVVYFARVNVAVWTLGHKGPQAPTPHTFTLWRNEQGLGPRFSMAAALFSQSQQLSVTPFSTSCPFTSHGLSSTGAMTWTSSSSYPDYIPLFSKPALKGLWINFDRSCGTLLSRSREVTLSRALPHESEPGWCTHLPTLFRGHVGFLSSTDGPRLESMLKTPVSSSAK